MRRALYDYEVEPWDERKPYNIWEDMADHLELEAASRVIDFGSNDNYFHGILHHKGFKGEYIGVDIEGKDLPAIEYMARLRHPNVSFIQGDAQNLRGKIESDSTDRAVAAFLGYHVQRPGRVLSELHRVLVDGGIGEVATRDVTNQRDTWLVARQVAHNNGFAFPQEINQATNRLISGFPIERIIVYSHFDIARAKQALSDTKKFEIIHEYMQDKPLYIPMTNIGLFDLENVVESLLPYTVKIDSGLPLEDPDRRPTEGDLQIMRSYIYRFMRRYFIHVAQKTQERLGLQQPYYISHTSQAFFVIKAIKPDSQK